MYEVRMFWYEISAQETRDIMACRKDSDARYDEWFCEVQRIAKLMEWTPTAIASIDKQAWKTYFYDRNSPAQAWLEEFDSANR